MTAKAGVSFQLCKTKLVRKKLNETLKKISGVPNKSWAEEVQDFSEMADL